MYVFIYQLYVLMWRLHKFVLLLELRIKMMPDTEFVNFIKKLEPDQKVYAIFLKYW